MFQERKEGSPYSKGGNIGRKARLKDDEGRKAQKTKGRKESIVSRKEGRKK